MNIHNKFQEQGKDQENQKKKEAKYIKKQSQEKHQKRNILVNQQVQKKSLSLIK